MRARVMLASLAALALLVVVDGAAAQGKVQKVSKKLLERADKRLGGLKDAELKALSRQNLAESQQGYGQVVAAGRSVADQYDAFVTTLRNQLKYLEVDLSDKAIEKLKSSNQDLRGQAKELQSRVGGLKSEIKRYVTAMK